MVLPLRAGRRAGGKARSRCTAQTLDVALPEEQFQLIREGCRGPAPAVPQPEAVVQPAHDPPCLPIERHRAEEPTFGRGRCGGEIRLGRRATPHADVGPPCSPRVPAHVESRTPPADQLQLAQQRTELVRRGLPDKLFRVTGDSPSLVKRGLPTEVAQQSLAEIPRLAHVNQFIFRADHAVHAGRFRTMHPNGLPGSFPTRGQRNPRSPQLARRRQRARPKTVEPIALQEGSHTRTFSGHR